MSIPVRVLFTPADFAALTQADLAGATCVVFDVLRATSTMVTALANGAAAVYPVADLAAALAFRERMPDALLGGERNGVRIRAAQTGGVDFDLGNSPRECQPGRVKGKTIITTTTNGTRALQACAGADAVLAGAFLNLTATSRWLISHPPRRLILVCAGTGEETAWEDALAAGALWNALAGAESECESGVPRLRGALDLLPEGGTPSKDARMVLPWDPADSAHFARQLYLQSAADLLASMRHSRNGRRLLSMPELADDVAFSLQRDSHPVVAVMDRQGALRPTQAGCLCQ
jgi:2-phosphosulfolactate phosphatase